MFRFNLKKVIVLHGLYISVYHDCHCTYLTLHTAIGMGKTYFVKTRVENFQTHFCTRFKIKNTFKNDKSKNENNYQNDRFQNTSQFYINKII